MKIHYIGVFSFLSCINVKDIVCDAIPDPGVLKHGDIVVCVMGNTKWMYRVKSKYPCYESTVSKFVFKAEKVGSAKQSQKYL